MRQLEKECAAMARRMLDAELVAISRRTLESTRVSALQAAVQQELRTRDIQE
ncbi:hypothetical protein SLG_35290 [Sphingobium sp. SYK-6]|uniref:hypothetical protein n=1 Tax=Sphingobium sp. (strain NBRC 103272 / SYK-6) TaxID=627192 RepID=UPI0002277B8F|nr:hypothetical protein [Sphingobium sp. SYK-6]BAK68204.1 hypothetical protein SLG_35290 [Sphingobium sp. SYK-6]